MRWNDPISQQIHWNRHQRRSAHNFPFIWIFIARRMVWIAKHRSSNSRTKFSFMCTSLWDHYFRPHRFYLSKQRQTDQIWFGTRNNVTYIHNFNWHFLYRAYYVAFQQFKFSPKPIHDTPLLRKQIFTMKFAYILFVFLGRARAISSILVLAHWPTINNCTSSIPVID